MSRRRRLKIAGDSGSAAGEPPAWAPDPAPTGRSLAQAVATALVLIAVVGIVYGAGRTAFFILACAVILVALFELYDALLQTGHKPGRVFGLSCGLGLMVAAYLERPGGIGAVLAVAVGGALLLALRPGRGAHPIGDAAWTVLGVAWIGGGGAAGVSMLSLEEGRLLVIAFIATTAFADIGAYFAGSAWGAHKMAPAISPNKSWEGYAGGFACAFAGGATLGASIAVISLAQGAAIGAICGLIGPAGDLVESLVKRELGIKDSGRLLPGHGGVLDRMDAMIFCAPLVLLFLRGVAGLA